MLRSVVRAHPELLAGVSSQTGRCTGSGRECPEHALRSAGAPSLQFRGSADDTGSRDGRAPLAGGQFSCQHSDNECVPWSIGGTSLISRTGGHGPANGPSFSASIDGAFHSSPTCVGFLSAASNIAAGDTNGQVDAFVARISGNGRPRRVSLPGGRQTSNPTTAVAVSGNCKSIAFVTGGKMYVTKN